MTETQGTKRTSAVVVEGVELTEAVEVDEGVPDTDAVVVEEGVLDTDAVDVDEGVPDTDAVVVVESVADAEVEHRKHPCATTPVRGSHDTEGPPDVQ